MVTVMEVFTFCIADMITRLHNVSVETTETTIVVSLSLSYSGQYYIIIVLLEHIRN